MKNYQSLPFYICILFHNKIFFLMKNAQEIIINYDGIGWLDLQDCDLKGITLPTTIGGSLDLRDCDLKGITLPTTIGGSLYLRDCENVPNAVHNCGKEDRTISVYTNQEKQLVVSLGCFVGTEAQCHEAIDAKYHGTAAKEYKDKVSEAFKLYYESNGY